MTSSLKRPSLSKPTKGQKIPLYDLSFARARFKNKAHSFVLRVFRDSGMTKAELARMLGKKPEQITRWLAGPGNMTLDTLSDLVFAAKGEFVELGCVDELTKSKSNSRSPVWLYSVPTSERKESVTQNVDSGGASPILTVSSGKSGMSGITVTNERVR